MCVIASWILEIGRELFFGGGGGGGIFMDRDEVEVHKNDKKERGWYPTTMTEQASSITVLLQSKEISLYRESSMIVLFQEPGKKATRFVAQQNLESPSCFFCFLFCGRIGRIVSYLCGRIGKLTSVRKTIYK